jgi:RNA recognition motif-containing protein
LVNFDRRRNLVNIFVGNLSRDVTEDDLRQAFEAFGKVTSAAVIKDKITRESRGFGFVEMAVQTEATAAIAGMNGKDLKGQRVNVNEARPREERTGGGGGGRRSFGDDRRPSYGDDRRSSYGDDRRSSYGDDRRSGGDRNRRSSGGSSGGRRDTRRSSSW